MALMEVTRPTHTTDVQEHQMRERSRIQATTPCMGCGEETRGGYYCTDCRELREETRGEDLLCERAKEDIPWTT